MGKDDITLASTTDSPEEVRAALGLPAETDEEAEAREETESEEESQESAAEGEEEEPVEAEGDEETDEGEEGDDVSDEDAADAARTLGKRRVTARKRIADLTKARTAQAKRADALAAENARLKAELESSRRQPAAQEDDETPPAAAKPPEKPKPDAVPEPKEDDFDSFADYMDAKVDWKVNQALAKAAPTADRDEIVKEVRAELEAERAFQQQHSEYATRYKAAATKFEDFEETIDGSEVQISEIMRDFLRLEPSGPEILYYLAKHPDEATSMAHMPPAQVLRVFGHLEARLDAGTLHSADEDDGEAPPRRKVPVSSAPEPVESPRRKAKTGSLDPDRMSYKEFKAWREKQLRDRAS